MSRSRNRAGVLAVVVLVALALVPFRAVAQQRDPQDTRLRSNIGIILDTPFLNQEELPYESEFSGPYGGDVIVYEYDGNGMPVFMRISDAETGIPTMDIEVSYHDDGQIAEQRYLTWDENGGEIIYRDVMTFDAYTAAGPTEATLVLNDGESARLRIAYDDEGRLVGLEEDNAFGEGLFRRERYAWVQTSRGSVPFALQLELDQADEVERYTYLYDALGRLAAVEGYNVVRSDLANRRPVVEYYFYRREGYDELFGPIEPSEAAGETAAR